MAKENSQENYYTNEVTLVGRASTPAIEKELPSGDKVVEIGRAHV